MAFPKLSFGGAPVVVLLLVLISSLQVDGFGSFQNAARNWVRDGLPMNTHAVVAGFANNKSRGNGESSSTFLSAKKKKKNKKTGSSNNNNNNNKKKKKKTNPPVEDANAAVAADVDATVTVAKEEPAPVVADIATAVAKEEEPVVV